MNALFYLYQTKSIFRPTLDHWISTFYSSLKSLNQKKADCTILNKKFCIDFCTDALKEKMNFLVFPEYAHLVFEKLNQIFKFAVS